MRVAALWIWMAGWGHRACAGAAMVLVAAVVLVAARVLFAAVLGVRGHPVGHMVATDQPDRSMMLNSGRYNATMITATMPPMRTRRKGSSRRA